jgi:ADP-heptose:LPS heptosyltransferase
MTKRILFITATRIGDAVLSSGLLAHLVERHPDASFTIACGAPAAPLFARAPRLDRLIVVRKRPYKAHWLDLWSACAFRKWYLVVDLRASVFAWCVVARHRRVMRGRMEKAHRVEELGRVLGMDEPPAPRLWSDPDAEERAASLLKDIEGPVLALGPTANWGGKEWRAERFVELVHRLTGSDGPLPGGAVAVMGAPDERQRALPLIDSVPAGRLIDLFGETLPVAYACIRRMDLFIGNDSGLMHLAAASGTPTLGLFGPSPEWRYGPWGAHTAVVRTPQSYEELCHAPEFDFRSQQTLMDGLDVGAVEQAARDLLLRCDATLLPSGRQSQAK